MEEEKEITGDFKQYASFLVKMS